MLFNDIKVAFRNLRKHKTYTAINVVGFAVGLACCLLIGLYVQHELSFDRFHEKADRTYRIILDSVILENEIESPLTPAPMAEVLVRDYPEVEHATRIRGTDIFDNPELTIEYEDNRFAERRLYFADASLFDVFSFPILHGDPATMLRDPFSIVLTESTAAKYFGEESALGKSLLVNKEEVYKVTGVIEDVPSASHWQFDFLASLSSQPEYTNSDWFNNSLFTYFTTKPGADIRQLEEKLTPFVHEQIAPQMGALLGVTLTEFHAGGGKLEYYAQPLTDIHLYSNLRRELGANGDAVLVYSFLAIALLILLIASANFINLSTAQSSKRAKEVGVRKVLGSDNRRLRIQFLVEAQLLCIMASGIAVFLVWQILPVFNDRLDWALHLPFDASYFIPALVLFILGIGLLAGLYPAFYLSALKPAKVLKGPLRTGSRGSRLRSGLVIAQFTITIILVSLTSFISQQMKYIQNKRLGFDASEVVTIDRGALEQHHSTGFKNEIAQLPGVQLVAAMDFVPDNLISSASLFRPPEAPEDQLEVIWRIQVDEEFIETLGMQMVAGSKASAESASGTPQVLLNETAAALFGWDDPVGELLTTQSTETQFRVAGVLEDFHFESLHQQVKPMVVTLADASSLKYIAVRLHAGTVPETLQSIEAISKTYYPEAPLVINFLDDQLDALYRRDREQGELLSLLTGLAIFIACLGLLGLAAFITEQRVKEIGVRKVMGASVPQIIALFSKSFLARVAISYCIAIPISVYLIGLWLERFAYKLPITWGIFALSGFIVLIIVQGTISYHSIRAALTNPIKSLRYE